VPKCRTVGGQRAAGPLSYPQTWYTMRHCELGGVVERHDVPRTGCDRVTTVITLKINRDILGRPALGLGSRCAFRDRADVMVHLYGGVISLLILRSERL